MSGNWLALRRVGEWAGLSDKSLEKYLSIVRPIHHGALQNSNVQNNRTDSPPEVYFNFLNSRVLSNPEVVEFLEGEGVEKSKVSAFESAQVPIQEAFRKRSVVDYGLDELVDLVMLLKLFDEYRERTGESYIEPLEKVHTLVYLTNHRISEERSDQFSATYLEFGMLERTGFRYTFNKRDGYVWSDSLQRDIDRLVAWNALDKGLIDEPKTEWDISYSVSLGTAAEVFLTRFKSKLSNFDSFLLNEWERKQDSVLRDLADTSKIGLSDHLSTIPGFADRSAGQIVLNGRARQFEADDQTSGVKTNA